MTNVAIARKLGTHTDKVGRWRRRYADKGIRGIEKERPRGGNHGGRCPKAQAALRTEIIRRTTQEVPPDATHWSCRSMAKAAGTTHSFVNTVWRSAGLEAPSVAHLQGEYGSALRGEAARRCGAVP